MFVTPIINYLRDLYRNVYLPIGKPRHYLFKSTWPIVKRHNKTKLTNDKYKLRTFNHKSLAFMT